MNVRNRGVTIHRSSSKINHKTCEKLESATTLTQWDSEGPLRSHIRLPAKIDDVSPGNDRYLQTSVPT